MELSEDILHLVSKYMIEKCRKKKKLTFGNDELADLMTELTHVVARCIVGLNQKTMQRETLIKGFDEALRLAVEFYGEEYERA